MDNNDLINLKNRFDVVGIDPEFNRALEMAVKIAPNDLTVLICGESGVGKEVIPQIIHQNSTRKNGRYLAVNCGGIPSGTINSELFGHEKGSFTGAVAERKGYFEEADGGTLFLDEIGELPLDTQALLLRVLQSGEFMKVGSSKTQKTDVRVIAATNVNLEYAVATGKFREDLYYRLDGVKIKVPPLRERKGDIDLLFRKFSSDFAQKYRLCKIKLSHEALTVLTGYRWPGNIRQLRNVAEAVTAMESRPASVESDRIEISASVLRSHMPDEKDSLLPSLPKGAAAGTGISDAEKQAIIGAIAVLKKDVDAIKEVLAGMSASDAAAQPASRMIASPEETEPEFQDIEPEAPAPPKSIREQQNDAIMRALEKYNGSVKDAARELGISERTIYRKISAGKK